MNKKIADLLNAQIKLEFESAFIYLSMAAQAEAMNMKGLASWMYVQHQEEHTHAMNIFNYLNERGHHVTLGAMTAPDVSWKTPIDIFKAGLTHEKLITASINKLMETSIKESDYATMVFLQWYVSEQVEEEASFTEVIGKFEMADTKAAIMLLDNELAARTFNSTLVVKATPVQLA